MCKYTTIFTIVDDFCKTYEDWTRNKLLTSGKQRSREGKLSLSEAISIMIFYHFSCLVPLSSGKVYTELKKDNLWDKYYTSAPRLRKELEVKCSNLKKRPLY
jgi:hypothetical protein